MVQFLCFTSNMIISMFFYHHIYRLPNGFEVKQNLVKTQNYVARAEAHQISLGHVYTTEREMGTWQGVTCAAWCTLLCAGSCSALSSTLLSVSSGPGEVHCKTSSLLCVYFFSFKAHEIWCAPEHFL